MRARISCECDADHARIQATQQASYPEGLELPMATCAQIIMTTFRAGAAMVAVDGL